MATGTPSGADLSVNAGPKSPARSMLFARSWHRLPQLGADSRSSFASTLRLAILAARGPVPIGGALTCVRFSLCAHGAVTIMD